MESSFVRTGDLLEFLQFSVRLISGISDRPGGEQIIGCMYNEIKIYSKVKSQGFIITPFANYGCFTI